MLIYKLLWKISGRRDVLEQPATDLAPTACPGFEHRLRGNFNGVRPEVRANKNLTADMRGTATTYGHRSLCKWVARLRSIFHVYILHQINVNVGHARLNNYVISCGRSLIMVGQEEVFECRTIVGPC